MFPGPPEKHAILLPILENGLLERLLESLCGFVLYLSTTIPQADTLISRHHGEAPSKSCPTRRFRVGRSVGTHGRLGAGAARRRDILAHDGARRPELLTEQERGRAGASLRGAAWRERGSRGGCSTRGRAQTRRERHETGEAAAGPMFLMHAVPGIHDPPHRSGRRRRRHSDR